MADREPVTVLFDRCAQPVRSLMPDITQPRDAAGRPTDHSPAAIRARYDAASDHVAALCQGERWTMRIPAQPDRDTDLVISDSLDDIPRLLARVQAVRDRCEEYRKAGHVAMDVDTILFLLEGGTDV